MKLVCTCEWLPVLIKCFSVKFSDNSQKHVFLLGGISGVGRKKSPFPGMYKLGESDTGWIKLDYDWPSMEGPTQVPLSFLQSNNWPNLRARELPGKQWTKMAKGCMKGYNKTAILKTMPLYNSIWNCKHECQNTKGCVSFELARKMRRKYVNVKPFCTLFSVRRTDFKIRFRNYCKIKATVRYYFERLAV